MLLGTEACEGIGDISIMEVAVDMYTGGQLQQINMCRIALKVTFLSDIASVDGKRILLAYYNGKHHSESGRRTRLHWPPMGEVPQAWWLLWQSFLERWCGTALLLSEPLGRWYAGAEMLTQCCCFLHGTRLIIMQQKGIFMSLRHTQQDRELDLSYERTRLKTYIYFSKRKSWTLFLKAKAFLLLRKANRE